MTPVVMPGAPVEMGEFGLPVQRMQLYAMNTMLKSQMLNYVKPSLAKTFDPTLVLYVGMDGVELYDSNKKYSEGFIGAFQLIDQPQRFPQVLVASYQLVNIIKVNADGVLMDVSVIKIARKEVGKK